MTIENIVLRGGPRSGERLRDVGEAGGEFVEHDISGAEVSIEGGGVLKVSFGTECHYFAPGEWRSAKIDSNAVIVAVAEPADGR